METNNINGLNNDEHNLVDQFRRTDRPEDQLHDDQFDAQHNDQHLFTNNNVVINPTPAILRPPDNNNLNQDDNNQDVIRGGDNEVNNEIPVNNVNPNPTNPNMNGGLTTEDLAVYTALNNNYLAYRMGKIDNALKNAQRYDEDNLNKIHRKKNKKIYANDDTEDDDVFNLTHSEDDIKRAVVKYYYKKVVDKWIYKDSEYISLLQYINVADGKCEISKNKDNMPTTKYKHLSEEDKKLFNKKLECMRASILDKENVKLILIKIKDKNNVTWYALNKKINKPTIKHAIYKAFLKKINKMAR